MVALSFGAGKTGKPPTLHLLGGKVDSLVEHSQRLNPGVLDCIDS